MIAILMFQKQYLQNPYKMNSEWFTLVPILIDPEHIAFSYST